MEMACGWTSTRSRTAKEEATEVKVSLWNRGVYGKAGSTRKRREKLLDKNFRFVQRVQLVACAKSKQDELTEGEEMKQQ